MEKILKIEQSFYEVRILGINRLLVIDDFDLVENTENVDAEYKDTRSSTRYLCNTMHIRLKQDRVLEILKSIGIPWTETEGILRYSNVWEAREQLGHSQKLIHSDRPRPEGHSCAVSREVSYRGIKKADVAKRQAKLRSELVRLNVEWWQHRDEYLTALVEEANMDLQLIVGRSYSLVKRKIESFIKDLNVKDSWLEENGGAACRDIRRRLDKVAEQMRELKDKRMVLKRKLAEYERAVVYEHLSPLLQCNEELHEYMDELFAKHKDDIPESRQTIFGG